MFHNLEPQKYKNISAECETDVNVEKEVSRHILKKHRRRKVHLVDASNVLINENVHDHDYNPGTVCSEVSRI